MKHSLIANPTFQHVFALHSNKFQAETNKRTDCVWRYFSIACCLIEKEKTNVHFFSDRISDNGETSGFRVSSFVYRSRIEFPFLLCELLSLPLFRLNSD